MPSEDWMNKFGTALRGQIAADVQTIVTGIAAGIPGGVWGQPLQRPGSAEAPVAGDWIRYGETSDATQADRVIAAVGHGTAPTIDYDELAKRIAPLLPAIDYARLAKAVNDDASKRLAE